MRYKKIFQALLSTLLLSLSICLALPAELALAQTTTLSPRSGAVGSTVSVSATGYSNNATYQVTFAYGSSYAIVVRTGTVSANSTIIDSFAVPEVPSGNYTVRVETSATNATDTFMVTPSLSLSATSFHVGDLVTVSGYGFGANTTVTVSFAGSTVTSPSTNTYGTFTTSFNVPASTTGAHTVNASDTVNSQSTTLSVVPFITLSPTSGAPGTTVTVTGTGFQAGWSVTITYAGSTLTTVPASIVTISVGSFSATFNIPPGPSGTAHVVASDSINMASATFGAIAGIRSVPASGNVGIEVSITGSGFSASTQVTISFDGIQVMQTNSDANGSFTVTFNVPASTSGQHTITTNDGTNSASTTFTTQPAIVLTPNTGKVGTQITVAGSGFAASQQTNVSVENSVMATVTTDGNGSFTAGFNAPASTAGQHSVTANDGVNSTSGTFTTITNMSVNPVSGQMGAKVTISGSGFGASRSITISFGNTRLKTTTTDANGSFNDSFSVPQLDSGTYNVTATDGTNTASLVFTLTTSSNINPTTGNVGSTVTVRGSGFSSTVTIKYDNTVVATTVADSNGAILATFSVPASVHGDHVVTVSTATTTLQTVFTMESIPPLVPTLLTPSSGAREGARPTMTWQAVTDPSGVTYTLQIATDSGFTGIILQKEGLTTPEYTLIPAEKLASTKQDAPYYWRVRAIDLASNQSDWSTPSSFYVGSLPDWAKYTLITLGAITAVLLIFWLGIMTGRRSG